MKLNEYLKANDFTEIAFIQKVKDKTGHEMPQGTLAKYILNQRTPRKKELNLIYQATEGAVAPNDFYLD